MIFRTALNGYRFGFHLLTDSNRPNNNIGVYIILAAYRTFSLGKMNYFRAVFNSSVESNFAVALVLHCYAL